MCVTGCPYKKVYFNHRTGKAEKCTFCFPRVEVGIPTVCSETCVGRLRYIGIVLYDADKVLEAASTPDDKDLYAAQRSILLDPHDPQVVRAAEQAGISRDWIDAAQRSPIYALINRFEVALPLHPEYRTMPMVWYIPPLSPVVDALTETGHDGEDVGNIFGAIESLRIPVEYLAELFTAGDTDRVTGVLKKLGAMRSYMRDLNLGRPADESIAAAVGMTGRDIEDMHRLLAIAKYDERYVIPLAHAEQGPGQEELDTGCSLDYDEGPGMGGWGPFGETSGGSTPIAVENFHMLAARQTTDTIAAPGDKAQRVNLLNWDGKGAPEGMFPPSPTSRLHATAGRRRGRADSPDVTDPAVSRRLACPAPSRSPGTWPSPGRRRPCCSATPTRNCSPGCRCCGPRSRPCRWSSPDRWAGSSTTWRPRPWPQQQADYVETFDLRRRCCLYLTYFTHGDTRKRGMALLQFKHLYGRAGHDADGRRTARPPRRRAGVHRHRRRRPRASGC